MKQLLLLAAFAIATSGFSQVTFVSQIPAIGVSYGFSSVEFFDDNNGYAIQGNNVSRTTDGGLTWDLVSETIGGFNFNCPIEYGADFNHVFLTFSNGGSYRTTNGGQTFEQLTQLGYQQATRFHFRDNLNGYYTSQQYMVTNYFRTVDGGNTWTSTSFEPGVKFVEFPAAGSESGILIAGNNIYHTANNGQNWNLFATPKIPGNYFNAYFSGVFFDLQNILMLSSDNTIKTTNGGLNWTVAGNQGGAEIAFLNPNVGYLRKNYPDNNAAATSVYKTYNGGQTWEAMSGFGEFQTDQEERLIDISIPTGSVGYAMTSLGKLYKFDLTLNTKSFGKDQIAFWPNPAQEWLHLADQNLDAKPFAIFDLTGRTISQGTVNNQKIDLGNLKSGCYFLKIADLQTVKFKKQ